MRAMDPRRIDPATTEFQDLHDAVNYPAIIDPSLASHICRMMRLESRKLDIVQPKIIANRWWSPFRKP